MNTWMVRAGRSGRFAASFRDGGFVAVGWSQLGDLSGVQSREEISRRLAQTNPEARDQTRLVWSGVLFRFVQKLAIKDRVVSYDPGSRMYMCGTIEGTYEYRPESEFEHIVNRRAVSWSHEISRDNLSATAQNTLGSTLTLFSVPEYISAELWRDPVITPSVEGSESENLEHDAPSLASLGYAQIVDAAREAISDKIAGLGPYEMQELVAGLLRAMGYKTAVSKPGTDRGRDIVASPDGFGFQEPRIMVEVKHRPGERIGAPDVRSFLGGRHTSDKGLYVSTGGFSTEARYEAERARIPLTLMDFEGLIDAILDNYERFDARSRELLELRTFYWPSDA